MAMEKRWAAVPQQAFVSDGTSGGAIGLTSAAGLKVKQKVTIKADGEPDLNLEIKRIPSETQVIVGPFGSIDLKQDLSAYTVAKNATISAPLQPRPSIEQKEYERATYDEEPTVAKRSVLVDRFGNYVNLSQESGLIISDSLQESFDLKTRAFDFTASPAATTVGSFLINDEFKLHVLEFFAPDGVPGDYVKVEIVDTDNVLGGGAGALVETLVEKWNLEPATINGISGLTYTLPASGLYLKVSYTSVLGVSSTPVFINLSAYKRKA